MENNEGKAKRGKGRLIFWLILFIVFIIIAAACVGIWAYHIVLRHTMNELYNDARVILNDAPDVNMGTSDASDDLPVTPLPDDENKGEETDAKPMVSIDFEMLKATSADVYAWIEIPGTPVAFPIVQHPTNNNYYLRKAINGSYDITGCIYTQNYNSKDFSDKNTVIYGHYMDDGTKFGSLLSYMDHEFFEAHRRIDVYTENEWFTYEVFAAIPFNTRHILKSYKTVIDPHEAFLKDVYSSADARSIIDEDVKVDPETDRIITLSTCLKTDTRRYLVLAKLVKSQLCE
ncbi:MAG: class B sortase [Clostridia bacterium]|nr:class B sortase [Clostridia bacterium]